MGGDHQHAAGVVQPVERELGLRHSRELALSEQARKEGAGKSEQDCRREALWQSDCHATTHDT
jgi:HD-like signal output (HDOD) protein